MQNWKRLSKRGRVGPNLPPDPLPISLRLLSPPAQLPLLSDAAVRFAAAFDYDSGNYVGLRMLDRVVDFETGERDEAHDVRAESVGELLDCL